jgi:uncharacterized protein (TIGR02466 family)
MTTSLPNDNHAIEGLFPSPLYVTKRDSNSDSIEEKEIEDIIKEGMTRRNNVLDQRTCNTYIFDTKLKNLKEFCEQHIKTYVKEVLNPEEELDFYITQSWLNVVEPDGNIEYHCHENSIISGVYYISTVEDDRICFHDPNAKIKGLIKFEPKEYNLWNSVTWFIPVSNNLLLLFPSWFEHAVKPNEKATTDRISISFNIFVKGTIGTKDDLNVLNLPDPR